MGRKGEREKGRKGDWEIFIRKIQCSPWKKEENITI
jgi:hypothetical protein